LLVSGVLWYERASPYIAAEDVAFLTSAYRDRALLAYDTTSSNVIGTARIRTAVATLATNAHALLMMDTTVGCWLYGDVPASGDVWASSGAVWTVYAAGLGDLTNSSLYPAIGTDRAAFRRLASLGDSTIGPGVGAPSWWESAGLQIDGGVPAVQPGKWFLTTNDLNQIRMILEPQSNRVFWVPSWSVFYEDYNAYYGYTYYVEDAFLYPPYSSLDLRFFPYYDGPWYSDPDGYDIFPTLANPEYVGATASAGEYMRSNRVSRLQIFAPFSASGGRGTELRYYELYDGAAPTDGTPVALTVPGAVGADLAVRSANFVCIVRFDFGWPTNNAYTPGWLE